MPTLSIPGASILWWADLAIWCLTFAGLSAILLTLLGLGWWIYSGYRASKGL